MISVNMIVRENGGAKMLVQEQCQERLVMPMLRRSRFHIRRVLAKFVRGINQREAVSLL